MSIYYLNDYSYSCKKPELINKNGMLDDFEGNYDISSDPHLTIAALAAMSFSHQLDGLKESYALSPDPYLTINSLAAMSLNSGYAANSKQRAARDLTNAHRLDTNTNPSSNETVLINDPTDDLPLSEAASLPEVSQKADNSALISNLDLRRPPARTRREASVPVEANISEETQVSPKASIPEKTSVSTVSLVNTEETTYFTILSDKIVKVASKIFAFLVEFFTKKGTEFLQFAWPYTNDDITDDVISGLDEIIDRAHKKIGEPEKPIPFYEESASPLVNSVLTTAQLVTNHVVIPYHIAQEGDFSVSGFGTAIVTARMSQQYFALFLGLSHNKNYQNMYLQLLRKYDLISTMDKTDLTLYQSGVAVGAHLVSTNMESFSKGMPLLVLKTAVVFIAHYPPAQRAVAGTELFKNCSQLAHKTTDYFRDSAIDMLSKPVEKMLVHTTKKLMAGRKPYVEGLQEMVDLSELTTPINEGINSLYNYLPPQLQNMFDTVVDRQIKQPAVDFTVNATKGTAKSISTFIVDRSVTAVISGIETSLFNQAVSRMFSSHPLLGCAVFVLGAGTNPSVKELSIRVAGAAVMCYTGSIFFATIVTCTPPAIEYVWNLRADGKRRFEEKKRMMEQRKLKLSANLANKEVETRSRVTPLFPLQPELSMSSLVSMVVPYQVKIMAHTLQPSLNNGFGC